jgi:hypothetical protein
MLKGQAAKLNAMKEALRVRRRIGRAARVVRTLTLVE